MSVGEMSVDKMSVGKMSVDKMSVGEMSVDKMSRRQSNIFMTKFETKTTLYFFFFLSPKERTQCPHGLQRGARKLTRVNLKVVWAKF